MIIQNGLQRLGDVKIDRKIAMNFEKIFTLDKRDLKYNFIQKTYQLSVTIRLIHFNCEM